MINWPPLPDVTPPKEYYALYRTEHSCTVVCVIASLFMTIAWAFNATFASPSNVMLAWGGALHFAWQASKTREMIRDGEALRRKMVADRAAWEEAHRVQ